MMNISNSPMDMITNRYKKPVQTPSWGAEGTGPDGVAIEQCQSAYRQNMRTTADEMWGNSADEAEPSRYQETAAAEGAGASGTTNVRDRSINDNKRKTTGGKLPTNCVVFTEPTSGRVSPVVAETVHTDDTGVMQYQGDDQKSIKTTEARMPRDYLEIPEPRLPRVFLELAEEVRNVKVENGRSGYTRETQPQETGLDRPVFITIMVDSPQKGVLRATGVSTEMIPNMSSAGREEPGDRSGLVGPQNKTEQPVLLGSDGNQSGTAPMGPVGPDILMDRIQPVVEGPVGQNGTSRPVGREGMFSASISDQTMADGPVGSTGILGPVDQTGSHVRAEFEKIGMINGPASSGSTHPLE